jgi:hypothetical protein
MAAIQPFSPAYNSGQTVTATTTAASATINGNSLNVLVTNTGSNIAYVRIASSAVTATASDMIILPSTQVSLTKSFGDTIISYLGVAAGNTSLHIMTGEGFAR